MKKLLLLIALVLSLSTLQANMTSGQTLITVHGFLGAPWNMYFMGSGYDKIGVQVIHWGYPSRDKIIEEHAKDLVKELQTIAKKAPGAPINYITHSMGGLILRSALNDPNCPAEAKIGRAVLLAPPNQGAVWGRLIQNITLAQRIGKNESGRQLMSEKDFEFLGLFPDSMEVFVIAGNLSINPLISGENDGTVAVDETFLTTPHKHAVIKAGHKSIIVSKEAFGLTQKFLLGKE
jgi:pimeloyl-ACP methyl ester carboxylesterase